MRTIAIGLGGAAPRGATAGNLGRGLLAGMIAAGVAFFVASPAGRVAAESLLISQPGSETPRIASYGELPLSFVPNRGQTDARVRFTAQAAGATFFFTDREAVLAFPGRERGTSVRLAFLGARGDPQVVGRKPHAGRVNYLVGNDPSVWQTNVPMFGEIAYRELWPGIDMVFRGLQGSLKYEFVVRPGASVSDIRLAYRGAGPLSVTAAGGLEIPTPLGKLRDERPRSFQLVRGERRPVASRFVLGSSRAGEYGFVVGDYNRRRPLVIDPGLAYSTYLGGAGSDYARAIAVDASGSAYVTGATQSADFPTTAGVFAASKEGDADVFVTKLDPTGSTIVYSTFIGGSAYDSATGLAVDADGNAYLAGVTYSADFPTGPNTFDSTPNGGAYDSFVAKLDASGSTLAYSSYLGGSAGDQALDLAIDSSGRAYVTGDTSSPNFPTTPGALDTTGGHDAFVTRIDADGSALSYSTYLGGSGFDQAQGIAVDAGGDAYVAGGTHTADFPTTPGAFDPAGGFGVFVSRLNSAGSALVFSTNFGGSSFDFATAIALDAAGNAYVTGRTNGGWPTTPGAFDSTLSGDNDIFVSKLDASGSTLLYSTYLGATSGDEKGLAIAVDASGNAHVTGESASHEGTHLFPETDGAIPAAHGPDNCGETGFVTKLDPAGQSLLYSTYLGGSSCEEGYGIAVDAAGAVYVAGYTLSVDFPVTPGALDTSHEGPTDNFLTGSDVFVSKLIVLAAPADADEDGVADDVDTGAGTFDDGEGTAGAIVDAQGLTVAIADAPDPAGVTVTVGAGTGFVVLQVCGSAVHVHAGTQATVTCGSITVEVLTGSIEIVLADGLATVLVPAGVTASVTNYGDGTFAVENLGGGNVTVTVDGVASTVAAGDSAPFAGWDFQGFAPPVENGGVLNRVKAGHTVSLKWRLIDNDGQPVTTLASATLSATSLACDLGQTPDQPDTTVSGKAIKNLGDGFYLINWKTPRSYANSCKTLTLDLGHGVRAQALFRFTK